MRLVVIAAARDDLADVIYDGRQPRTAAPTPAACAGVRFGQTPSIAADTLTEDLALIARRVHRHTGVEPLLVDLSHGDQGIPVVLVHRPGARLQFESLGLREAAAA